MGLLRHLQLAVGEDGDDAVGEQMGFPERHERVAALEARLVGRAGDTLERARQLDGGHVLIGENRRLFEHGQIRAVVAAIIADCGEKGIETAELRGWSHAWPAGELVELAAVGEHDIEGLARPGGIER